MALLPVMLSDLLEDPWMSLPDQRFGLGLLPTDIPSPAFNVSRGGYYGPRRRRRGRRGASRVVNKDMFKVYLDVQQFRPEEITVKVVDNFLVIEGKHEERRDQHGFVSRQFTRRYAIPEGVNIDAVACEISSDGVLTVTAPKKALTEAQNERIIPITQTNAPALEGKVASTATSNAESSDKTE